MSSSPKEKQSGEVEVKDSLTPEELEQQQLKEKELLERIHKAMACTYVLPLGKDRLYRRYWLFPSAGALFVEDDFFGLTEDMLEPRPTPEPKMEDALFVESPVKTNDTAKEPMLVHNTFPPVNRPNQWFLYNTAEEVEQLIEALNPRGHRESTLKETLLQEKERIIQLLDEKAAQRYRHSGTVCLTVCIACKRFRIDNLISVCHKQEMLKYFMKCLHYLCMRLNCY